MRLERWITDTVDDVADPENRKPVRHYATWHLMRRLRARNRGSPVTYGQFTGIRQRLRGAIAILDWLADQQLSLATCTQADIDRWLTDSNARYRTDGSGFLRWATTNKLVNTSLVGVGRGWQGPAELIAGEDRWATARRLLHDQTLKPEGRVAGLLVLLYAQRASTIAGLTTDHVTTGTNGVRLRLGSSPRRAARTTVHPRQVTGRHPIRARGHRRTPKLTVAVHRRTDQHRPNGQTATFIRNPTQPRPARPPCSPSPPRSAAARDRLGDGTS
ncbi:hypothetical protein AB4Z09_09405 [Rhodococcus sp. TAF43]|uniref:hypothetical protein n=1 Tax=unclassified Rhodococcus (in: high G+C Gram-positive bacteria) TaxID=192944 RepID=UPI001581FEA7|nr:hypothetical protein [Rhodococcus sp. W8901]QKT11687.1 hypothetical protein HUN07_13960 [Rhodococcus sp. W8901]